MRIVDSPPRLHSRSPWFFPSILSLLVAVSATLAVAQPARYVDPTEDVSRLAESGGALGSSGDGQIIRFRNWASVTSTREIEAGADTLVLPRSPIDFDTLRYEAGGRQHSVEDLMIHNHVGGLLVIKDGDILLERYGLGNNEDSLWVSFSMAKSVTSMLLGAAIRDGFIASVDDPVTEYLPRMRGSSYDQATIRHVLQMASGVAWNEDYADPNSDVGSYPGGDVLAMLHYLGDKPRVAPAGQEFNYNTGETDLVGAIVRSAIGNNLATYLEQKIWRPYGMESDANWATHGPGGGERGGCCINATLRDYGRLGLFAMGGGVLRDGTPVLPEGWMDESTSPSPAFDGYGYLWWLEGDGKFRASGIYGQGIYINPETNLVIVVLSAWTTATGAVYQSHRDGFFAAVDAMLER